MKVLEKHTKHATAPEDRIPFLQLIAYGFGGIVPIALFNIAGQLMVLIGNISLGLSAFWLGVIMIIPRLWDAVSDPIVGHLSDNTRSRWGRRRPYLLAGGIAVAASFVLMWWIPKGDVVQAWFPSEAAYQWFQLSYILVCLLIFFTSCTVFEIPHGALGMEMSADYHERTRLFSAKSFLGNLFAMSTPWLFALASLEVFKGPGGNEVDGMRYVSIIIAAVLVPLSFWWFSVVREPGFKIAARQEKSSFWRDIKHTASNKIFLGLVAIIFTLAMGFNFVALLGYYIPIFYLYGGDKAAAATLLGINGSIWAITGLIAVFPLNMLSRRFGKRRVLVLAIGLMCLAQLAKIVCYNPDYPYLIIIPTILLSAGMLFFFTLGSSMVGDVCDEDDLRHGHRSEGSFYSIYWWFIKMGTAFASLVTGLLILFTQFDQDQVKAVDSLQGSINELHAELRLDEDEPSAFEPEGLRARVVDAISIAEELLAYLDNKVAEGGEEQQVGEDAATESREAVLLQVRSRTTSTIDGLEAVLERLGEATARDEPRALAETVRSLTLEMLLQRSRVYASELIFHLQGEVRDVDYGAEHHATLLANAASVERSLVELEPRLEAYADSRNLLLQEIEHIAQSTAPLTLQSPRTLLLMRIIEIGLPLLLGLFSVFFALRYPLSEERCYEIKAALEKRNETRATA